MFLLIVSMLSFSLSMSISPGPVNLTILSSAMNYGVRQTFAFISGATIGFTALLTSVCFGLYQLIVLNPVLLDLITILGTLLLLWISWNILRAEPEIIKVDQKSTSRIPTFMEGALMQWLNPKAWIAAVSGTALFSASHNMGHLVLFILIYFVVCYFSLLIWGIVGDRMAHFLNVGHRSRIFNILMGLTLMMISLHMCWAHFYT